MRKISEEGVRFASPVNGDKLFLTPEVSIQIQTALNSDIAMQFDECTPYETAGRITSEADARTSMELSLRWAKRCQVEFARLENPNALFGIVQGGMFESLRKESAAALAEMDFPGYAIGGVSVGEPKDEMRHIVAHTPHRLPADKPRYLMGVRHAGRSARRRGPRRRYVRLRDGPTRNARNGTLFTRLGDLKIRNRAAQIRPAPARRALHLPCLRRQLRRGVGGRRARRLQPRLSASPGPLRRGCSGPCSARSTTCITTSN